MHFYFWTTFNRIEANSYYADGNNLKAKRMGVESLNLFTLWKDVTKEPVHRGKVGV